MARKEKRESAVKTAARLCVPNGKSRSRKIVREAYTNGAAVYYVEENVDHLDERAQRVLHKILIGLDHVSVDEVSNLIRDFIHERRWVRGEVAKRKRCLLESNDEDAESGADGLLD